MSKPRSARTKRLAREREQRAARRAPVHPLRALQPPFRPYAEWISVPPGADVPWPARLQNAGAAQLHAMVLRLAPLYAGQLPLAALYLEQQIERGTLHIARPEDFELVTRLAVDEVAALFTAAGIGTPGDGAGPSEYLHELHFHGALVLDDDHVICLDPRA